MSIGHRIRYLRKDILHLTQREFAIKLGISKQSLLKIEKSITHQPRADRIQKILEIYKVSEPWLLAGTGKIFGANPHPLPELEASVSNDNLEVRLKKIESEIRNLRTIINLLLEKL